MNAYNIFQNFYSKRIFKLKKKRKKYEKKF